MINRMSWVLAIGLMAGLNLAPAHLPQDPAVKKLATGRHEAAKTVWANLTRVWQTVQDFDSLALWSRRLAESSAASGAETERAAFGQHLVRLQDMLAMAKEEFKANRRSVVDIALIEYYVAEAKQLAGP